MTTSKNHSGPLTPEGAVRCVWMDAGLLKWKLCDRNLECEGCPLDAALRGLPLAAAADAAHGRRRPAWIFPDDRRYAAGHQWVQILENGRVRVGLDAFGAELLPGPGAIDLPATGLRLNRGEELARIVVDEGELGLGAPVGGRVLRTNDALLGNPAALVAHPYGEGWIAELDTAGLTGEEIDAFASGADMRRQARLDVQRLQRRVAMEVLVGHAGVGFAMADGGEPVTDLRQMLGPERYLEILQELVR